MSESPEFVVITSTSDQVDILKKIARQLVMDRCAACIQISGPITSVFNWDGRVDTVEEYSCAIKTTADKKEQVVQIILEMHNYSEPQILVLPVIDGSDSFLQWIRESVAE